MNKKLIENLLSVDQFTDAEIDLFNSKLVPVRLAKGDHFLKEGLCQHASDENRFPFLPRLAL